MNTDQTNETASARPENVPVSWQTWADLLSTEELEQIAKEVGLYEGSKLNYIGSCLRFEALCEGLAPAGSGQ